MKHLISVVLFIFIALILPNDIFAQSNFRSGENIVVQNGETIDSDFFAAGEKVIVEGTVNGDAYLAGGDVTLQGTVTGDVLVIAGNVTINGTINGNLRTGTGNLTINGTVAKNITAGAGNIAIAQDAKVGGSVTLGAGNITIQSPIGKGITAGAGRLLIGNTVGGDVNVAVEDFRLSDQASITGNMLYWSESPANVEEGASVSGAITHRIPEKQANNSSSTKKGWGSFWVGWHIMSYVTTLVLGGLVLKLVPEYLNRSVNIFTSKSLASLGIGLLILAATPVIVVLLLITVIGIPLISIWLFLLGLGIWMAKLLASITLGNWLQRNLKLTWNKYVLFGVGLLLYVMITSIPLLGWLVSIVVCLMGLGTFILTKRAYYLELRQQKIV